MDEYGTVSITTVISGFSASKRSSRSRRTSPSFPSSYHVMRISTGSCARVNAAGNARAAIRQSITRVRNFIGSLLNSETKRRKETIESVDASLLSLIHQLKRIILENDELRQPIAAFFTFGVGGRKGALFRAALGLLR